MTQLTLPDQPQNELEEKYRLWRASHAGVFALFEKFALQMLARKQRFGIAALLERVRWEVRMQWQTDADGYKINNNHKPYLARELIELHPELTPLIETRSVRSGCDG